MTQCATSFRLARKNGVKPKFCFNLISVHQTQRVRYFHRYRLLIAFSITERCQILVLQCSSYIIIADKRSE